VTHRAPCQPLLCWDSVTTSPVPPVPPQQGTRCPPLSPLPGQDPLRQDGSAAPVPQPKRSLGKGPARPPSPGERNGLLVNTRRAVSRQGSCWAAPAGPCLPGADNPGAGAAGCSRRDSSRLGRGASLSTLLPLGRGTVPCWDPAAAMSCPALPRALGWARTEGHPAATGWR